MRSKPVGWWAAAIAIGGMVFSSLASAQPVVAAFERFHGGENAAAGAIEGGLLLLNELNCVGCHAPPAAWRDRLRGRDRIVLSEVGDRLQAATIAAFIRDPQHVKPGTTMPTLITEVAVVDEIAKYLSSLRRAGPGKQFPRGNADRGRQLFHSVGCVACHAPAESVKATQSVPLALGRHYEGDALAAFLQDPLHARPDGRMPSFELKDNEAADLAVFLQRSAAGTSVVSSSASALPPSTAISGAALAAGRKEFTARNCVACHDDGSSARARPAVAIADLRLTNGCLAPQPSGGAPDFRLSAAQRRALAAALQFLQGAGATQNPTAEQRVSEKFAQLNCYGCHEWRGRGGPEEGRVKYFTAADSAAESLGELGHLPPKLDAAGRKLTQAWLEKLLWGSGGGVRPYLSVRMPRFGQTSTGELVSWLREACQPNIPLEIDTSGAKGHQRFGAGRDLIGTGPSGIGCVACHGLGEREPAGMRAINLTHTVRRIEPEYFKALLLDPQGLQPGTIMPPLFASRKNADKEIESLWTYLKEFNHNPRLPEGLAPAGVFELKPEVEGKPIVFRTFLEGAGTHAIAIGYPTGLNIAFDAHEVRWGVAWRGRFLDATANWEERTMPPVKPLGDAIRMMPARMPLARLASPTAPWPTNYGQAAEYVFRGYRLRADGTPVFRYRVAEIEVEDVIAPDSSGKALRRTLTLRRTGADGTWYFLGLAADAGPVPLVWNNGVAVVEETITL